MDNSSCVVLYLDRRARATGFLTAESLERAEKEGLHCLGDEDAAHNIHTILSAFGQAHICSDGMSCLASVAKLDESHSPTPIVVLLDIPIEDEVRRRKSSLDTRPPSPTTTRRNNVEKNEPNDLYGMPLLLYMASEIQQHARSRLVIPIAVPQSGLDPVTEPSRTLRYLDAGAVDVVPSPLNIERVRALAVHSYRRAKEVAREAASSAISKRNRKRSWVGIDDERPYAYLREIMVSGLLSGICNPEAAGESIDNSNLSIEPDRKRVIESAVGVWAFSAHDFDADELLYAALVMLKHALQMPELERWRMSTDDLTTFLMACRKAYNDFVLYHNFRHIVDVLQATFYFLLKIGLLPPYPDGEYADRTNLAPVATLLTPFDALTLLVSAIGHDVGHPGVNNAFLVALNAPLAQLYNDRSVLEAFHCAAYSQILRRFWPGAFADTAMRKLMINSILATDMGLHFKYMVDMGNLQGRLAASDNAIDGWTPKALEETRDLCCGLLIKCADISNVARKYDIAAQWAAILTDEFSNQGAMEKELDLPTCLFGGPPDRDDVIKMAESQIGFMNIFAGPLFEGMTHILPAMSFGIKEMGANRLVWERKIDVEKSRRSKDLRSFINQEAGPSTATAALSSTDDSDLEHEVEGLPPLLVERDNFVDPSKSPQSEDPRPKTPMDSSSRTHGDALTTSERRLRNLSLASTGTSRGHRKTSHSGSFHGPFGPYAHQHSGSRRSSKDAALEQLETLQLNSFSRLDSPGPDGARRGSADASLTTILVRSQTPQNKQGATSPNNTPSPIKRYPRSSSQPSQCGGPQSPSTKASSINEPEPPGSAEAPMEPNRAHASDAFLRPPTSGSDKRQTLSAPDILALHEAERAAMQPHALGKPEGSIEGEDGMHLEGHRNLRQSRSRSRLRGLRFWRKRWKSPSGAADVEHDD
ncbi:hypothetical protein AAFC00_001816 [Neodothiora populina]|uniref:Phosphodiesterase n=1 Tax=Neodothiora populina TaxID=2781224 RepID=A0ABR3PQ81_9PEZI